MIFWIRMGLAGFDLLVPPALEAVQRHGVVVSTQAEDGNRDTKTATAKQP
jgi:hypothetical protein